MQSNQFICNRINFVLEKKFKQIHFTVFCYRFWVCFSQNDCQFTWEEDERYMHAHKRMMSQHLRSWRVSPMTPLGYSRLCLMANCAGYVLTVGIDGGLDIFRHNYERLNSEEVVDISLDDQSSSPSFLLQAQYQRRLRDDLKPGLMRWIKMPIFCVPFTLFPLHSGGQI